MITVAGNSFMPIRDAHTKGNFMSKKMFVAAVLAAMMIAGCKNPLFSSYSGQLASLVKKIDPAYSKYMKLNSDLKEAMKKGDVQKAQSLSMQLHNGAISELDEAVTKAVETEKGKQIPFTQSDGQEGFVVKSATFSGLPRNSDGDLDVVFHLNSDVKSKERKWGVASVKAVNAKGDVLAEGSAYNNTNTKTATGETIYYGDFQQSLGKLNGLDHLVISSNHGKL